MTLSTRRQFVKQTALAAAALYWHPIQALAGGQKSSAENHAASVDPADIRRLASEIKGRLIAPGAPDYESSRLVFNRAFDQRPALIVRCAGASDIARALNFAQTRNLPLAVRGGGHSRAGFSVCDGGVVIDLSGMKRVEVDANKRVARAEAGSLVGDLDQATCRFGLATTAGGCPNVGLAGFTLGGGEGLLMSMFGAGCDNLLSARVVLADGKQVEISHDSNPDLFWAIRGGGGNFGVVTALEYRLHSIGNVLAGALTYPPGHIVDLLHGFARFTASAPDEMVPLGELLPSEQGPRFVDHVLYAGDPRTGNDLLRSVRSPLKPEDDNVREMSYLEAQTGGFRPAPFAHFQTNVFLPELSGAAAEAIATAVKSAPAQFRVLLVPFFGAITRVGVSDTAFPLRHPGFEVDILSSWSAPAEKATSVQWVKALRDSLKPFAHGAYVNQLGETSEDLVRTAYGPNYARLMKLKKKYDPDNVLRINQNIKPA
ncbi:MAG TPA: FAD-binding oxidoreductase [Candidatus Angelobacter sp.]|nr:FAD-binding oxidoreductase [Candidatus Angelobacter sp.]